ncbi:type I glyceraldehyde-3-phosphate dehydrogenase [Aquimarina intermedia]|uniref:Glyceraldehyde 3-phosphate dehydrogenase n=1 Tax=Aquimarina intermedia TaxID=350814 RepID=A0A5S5C7B2_9FLAO|nr:glyceraldehyde 3-phosphate dehydrogenase NAD-binding domain-containing protein [Aquimarina intermedia]TYP75187.1 glyceraldehyde 3-phosphate dehydrogenase [Aquimarina intermedia]
MKRIAINGFGRIGRAALKILMEDPDYEIVAVNDLMPIESASYLLKYDSVYGIYDKEVSVANDKLKVGEHLIHFFNEKDPAQLPWKENAVDIVIESTGFFTKREDAEKHIYAGATNVIISGPTKSKDTPMVVHGVNTKEGKTAIFSCASCTTNNISPVVEILGRRIGIQKAILNTIHAYTASQSLVDGSSKKNPRMGRAGAINLTPTSTGAAIATTKVLPEFEGKFDGVAIRTPVPVGSVSDVTFIAARNTSPEEINKILQEEAITDRYAEVLDITYEPIVSSDIKQNTYASVVDASMTRVVDGDLVKLMIWYDNEWGFTSQMIRQLKEI